MNKLLFAGLVLLLSLPGCKKSDPVKNGSSSFQLTAVSVGASSINLSGTVTEGLPVDQPILISFSSPLSISSVPSSITLSKGSLPSAVDYLYSNGNKTVTLLPRQKLDFSAQYTLTFSSQLKGSNNEIFPGLSVDFKTTPTALSVTYYKIGGQTISSYNRLLDQPLDLSIEIGFSAPLDQTKVTPATVGLSGPGSGTLVYTLSTDKKALTITQSTPLVYLSKYTIGISDALRGANGEVFNGFTRDFYTTLGNHTSGLPAKTDNELLDLIQKQTFLYFWDAAAGGHPASGMARERNSSGNTVTTGGSGFGVMAIVVAIDRGFIPRVDGVARLNKIVGFLEKADRFHGAWGHWMDGNTGHIIPFSTNDNGGDLVETSFMSEGLIACRQYLQPTDTAGNNLINRITTLYNGIEWDWYRNGNQNVLYWHWSPDKGWIMNFPMYGYFEEQITYFMAAGSPAHSIPKIVYSNGYGLNGGIKTGNTYTFGGESHVLPLAQPAPLFWTQYSYLGLDPHFTDDFANYWTQNTNATLISHAYCKANPLSYAGYSDSCWGLTASDSPTGYWAQSVGNDNGTITPTAALSSFPYTPVESMKALRFFYDRIGDRIWDPTYGPHDAFNITAGWYADSYLAIDQGPIPVMIENYRSGLIWNLFMSAPEVQVAKTKLGFQ
jgi:hypothetical protein